VPTFSGVRSNKVCDVPSSTKSTSSRSSSVTRTALFHAPTNTKAQQDTGFIATELRGAAMRLHTREQAPREGEVEAPAKPAEPYVPNHMDYLRFLVDSRHVYVAMEEIVESTPDLACYRNTGLERVKGLDIDIAWMASEYDLEIPEVGSAGLTYAKNLHQIVKNSIPAFMCHYYNYYFAHTAGGQMIGKQMSALLLDKKTLEFYKWDNLKGIKDKVKGDIETMAATWSREEKDECVEQTRDAFIGGGGMNAYLSGRQSPH